MLNQQPFTGSQIRLVVGMEDNSHVDYGQKCAGEQRSMKWHIVNDAKQFTWSQNSGHYFPLSHRAVTKVTLDCGIDLVVLWNEFFVDNPLDIKENKEHALDFIFICGTLFGLGEIKY